MSEVWLIRSTFPGKDEALLVARTLLDEKLIACANIDGPVTALYHWEDMMQQENETVLLAKTSRAKAKLALERIKALHTYKIPSLLAWPASHADRDFADWVQAETK